MYMGKEGREKGRVENWKKGIKEEKGTELPAWNDRNFSLFQPGNPSHRVAHLKQELFTFVYNLHAGFTTNPVSMDTHSLVWNFYTDAWILSTLNSPSLNGPSTLNRWWGLLRVISTDAATAFDKMPPLLKVNSLFKTGIERESPGGPVSGTPHFLCWGLGLGTEISGCATPQKGTEGIFHNITKAHLIN